MVLQARETGTWRCGSALQHAAFREPVMLIADSRTRQWYLPCGDLRSFSTGHLHFPACCWLHNKLQCKLIAFFSSSLTFGK